MLSPLSKGRELQFTRERACGLISVLRRVIIGVVLIALTGGAAAALDRAKLRSQIVKHEGRRSRVYKDAEGIPTVGVEFNLKQANARAKLAGLGLDYTKVLSGDQVLSDPQIDGLLDAEIDAALADCRAVFPGIDELSDVRQRVLADMMFNFGRARFSGFEMMNARVKAGDFAGAADEMKSSRWYTQFKDWGRMLEGMMRTGRDPS
jgi:lysozyme